VTNALITDVSFYEDDPQTPRHIDFVKMKNAGVSGTIVRAGQRNWTDTSFAQSWADAKAAGVPRGSYWFLDSRATPESQAHMYADILGDVDFGELPLFVDFEAIRDVPNTTATQLKVFIERLKILIPGKEIMIYTGPYYWSDNVPTSMHDYFDQYELWIANYGAQMPTIPKPWDTWAFWQFSEEGAGPIYGTEGRVDLNYFNGDVQAFKVRFGITDQPPIPPDPSPAGVKTHKGVTLYEVQRFGTKCYIHVIDPKIARIQISDCGFRKPSQALDIYHCQIVANGGGWPNKQDAQHRSNEMWVSNGRYMQDPQYIKDNRPYINVSQAGLVVVNPDAKVIAGIYNAVGFDRILLWNKVFNDKIDDRITKDARTGSGVTADGKYILLSADGDDRYKRGLTFPEMAQVFLEFGAINAGNNDGGSSTNVINTEISPDPLFVGSDGAEAPVINHIMVFAEPIIGGEIPPIDPPIGEEMKYTVEKSARYRSSPTMNTNDQGASSIVGDVFNSETTQIDFNNPAITMVLHPNGKWLPLTIDGVVYTKPESAVPPTPVPAKPMTISGEITAGGTLIIQVTDPNNLPAKVFVNGAEWHGP
jgi:lysozyme